MTSLMRKQFLHQVSPVARRAVLHSFIITRTDSSFSSHWVFNKLLIMTSKLSALFNPPECTGKTFDKSLFQKTVTVPALKVEKKEFVQVLLKRGFKSKTIRRWRFNFIRSGPDDVKYILLDPDQYQSDSDLRPNAELLQKCGVEVKLHDFDVELTYDNFSRDEVLKALLPEGLEVPSGYSKVGHIVHLNLKEQVLPYKHLIGEVVLDKTPGVKTVVNKVDEISNQFRVFNMEVLAGEPQFEVIVKEYSCIYQFDFSKVYWNPRLSNEHERIVNSLAGGVLFDVFAGVGPFAIPAAKKGIQVHANDLNPESFKWLEKNITANKVEKKVTAYNMDGKEFIQQVLKNFLLQQLQEESISTSSVYVIMNLPATAIEFLDTFRGLLNECETSLRKSAPRVIVNCHCFSKASDPDKDVQMRVEEALGYQGLKQTIHNVRNVAPNKEMLCSKFQVPAEILYASSCEKRDNHEDDEEESMKKRQKTD